MSVSAHLIRRLTAEAQPYLPQKEAGLYGLGAPPGPHLAGFEPYVIGNIQEPILNLPPGALPAGSFCVATQRGDAALCTKAIAHVDVDDRLLPPDYSDMSWNELADLLAERVDIAYRSHIGIGPGWISVYRTLAGWRLLTPPHPEAHLAALLIPGCDPRYCYVTHRQQGLHRIRLLPKPWRERERQVADRILFRGCQPTGPAAAVLRFHDDVCSASVGAAVCS